MGQDLVDLIEILQLPRHRSQALEPRGVTALNNELALLQVYKVATLVPARSLKLHRDRSPKPVSRSFISLSYQTRGAFNHPTENASDAQTLSRTSRLLSAESRTVGPGVPDEFSNALAKGRRSQPPGVPLIDKAQFKCAVKENRDGNAFRNISDAVVRRYNYAV